MKIRILKTVISVLLLLSLIASVCSCGEEEVTGEHYDYGLHYTIPEGYRKLTVPYSEFCYYDGNAYFYFHSYSPEQLADPESWNTEPNISVRNFTTKFMVEYDIPLYKYTYYEDIDRSVIIYDWEYDDTNEDEAGLEDECFYHVIFRGSQLLYVVTMTCPVSMKDTYTPVFDEWGFDLHAD